MVYCFKWFTSDHMTHYPPKTVLYIPGFLSGEDSQEKMLQALSCVFPSSYDISSLPWEMKKDNTWRFPWDSKGDTISESWNDYLSHTSDIVNVLADNNANILSKALLSLLIIPRWAQAIENVKIVSKAIAKSLLKLNDHEREKIILVGHSLGANIIIKTLYQLSTHNACIWKAVLLGAAINNNDKHIRPACNAVKDKIISVINPTDYALALYSLVNTEDALGRGYKGLISRQQFLEISTDPIPEHESLFYLQQLKKKA